MVQTWSTRLDAVTSALLCAPVILWQPTSMSYDKVAAWAAQVDHVADVAATQPQAAYGCLCL